MRTACGRGDFVANGAMFTAYHLHQPWSMPATLLDGIFSQAYPARRFQSIWIGIITHTVPSFAIIGFLLYLVVELGRTSSGTKCASKSCGSAGLGRRLSGARRC